MKNKKSLLEIQIHGASGSVRSFIQDDEVLASRIFDGLHPARLFTTGKITIAGEYSLTVFVASQVTRIDFISGQFACWEFPPNISDVVELSEAEFHQRLHQNGSAQMEKREKPQTPGDFAMRFLHVEMLGGQQIFLAIEIVVELPAERLNRIHFLLSAPTLHFRLQQGDVGVLNLTNMVHFTAYPQLQITVIIPKPFGRLKFLDTVKSVLPSNEDSFADHASLTQSQTSPLSILSRNKLNPK